MNPRILRVGEPYPDRVPPQEGSHYLWHRGGHDWMLFWATPTASEVKAVRKGKARLGLLNEDHVIVLLLRIGDLPWQEAFYHFQITLPPDRPELADLPTPQSRYPLNIILVDHATRILRVLRMTTMPPDFSRVLLDAVRVQAADTAFQPESYHSAINAIMQRYRTADDMARDCTITGWGGKP